MCPDCHKKVIYCVINTLSVAACRICEDASDGDGAVHLECVICGEIAINNRTCPSCAALYCTRCLQQWFESSGSEGSVSCACCRQAHAVELFAHDRFAAKLTRMASTVQGHSKPSKVRPKGQIQAKRTAELTDSDQPRRTRLKTSFLAFGQFLQANARWLLIMSALTGSLLVFVPSRWFDGNFAQRDPKGNCVFSALPAQGDISLYTMEILSRQSADIDSWSLNELSCSLEHCGTYVTMIPVAINIGSSRSHVLTACGWNDVTGQAAAARLMDVRLALKAASRQPMTYKHAQSVIWILHAMAVRLFLPDAKLYMEAVVASPSNASINKLNSVSKASPQFPYALLYNSIKLRSLHRAESAHRYVNACLKREPDNAECIVEEIEVLVALGRKELAQMRFRELDKIFPAYASLVAGVWGLDGSL